MGWKIVGLGLGLGAQEEGSLLTHADLDLESHNSGNHFHCLPKKESHGPQWGKEREEHIPYLGVSWDSLEEANNASGWRTPV